MKIVVGIPSRMGSSRFPGKPLCDILGRPMLEHVYRRCALANSVDEVFVATCNVEIENFCEKIGARSIATDPAISRPGLRVAEACKTLDLADDDIVVVVQGDEPLVRPEMIELAVQPLLEDADVYCANLTADMTEQEWLDPNEIKVVCDLKMNAIYMSRSPIPSRVHPEKPVIGPRLRQVCIMPFRKKDLLAFNSLSPTPLEEAESIEMLRAIEHGYKVRMVKTSFVSKSVDNEEDRRVVERLMQNDEIYRQHGF